jgi:hypothetical protein
VLSPANAPVLILVVPIAIVGSRWGLWSGLGLAIVAAALVVAPIWMRTQTGIVGYLSQATAFVTVAMLAGALHQRSDRSGEPAARVGGPGHDRRGRVEF